MLIVWNLLLWTPDVYLIVRSLTVHPCEAFDMQDARMGMVFLLSRMTGFKSREE